MSETKLIPDHSKEKEAWTALFASMENEEKEAKILYEKIMSDNKDKTYLDILPKEFKSFSKSSIKRTILYHIDKLEGFLNSSSLYNGRIFDKKEIVGYMMSGTKYSNFYLAENFIPKISSFDLHMDALSQIDKSLEGEERQKAIDAVLESDLNKVKVSEINKLTHLLNSSEQAWDLYKDRLNVKNGKLVNSYDMESDGFPSTGRGCCCYLFVPIKGNFPRNKKGEWELFNPRSKKHETYKILKYKAEDNIYKCESPTGKIVFFMMHDEISEAYDCLYSVNKEIYSGWWNKTLISN